MKKAILPVILISALAVTLCTSAIRPANAWIEDFEWLGRQHHDYDPYWHWSNISVYEEGSNATLLVQVHNNYGYDLNVSAVKVFMDWNLNYSSDECSEDVPLVIKSGEYHDFTITFTVPSTSVATNFLRHDYIIYVDEVNATTGPKEVTNFHDWSISWDDIIVYSTIQKEVMMLYDEINTVFSYYYSSFSSVVARSLWYNGSIHYQMGLDSYESSNFDSAKTHYETALGLLNQAIDTETAYDLDWQQFDNNYTRQWKQTDLLEKEANLTIREAIANASMIEADASMKTADAQFALAQAAMTQAYAWIVFGIGFVVFGFAAVIWASKKPSSP